MKYLTNDIMDKIISFCFNAFNTSTIGNDITIRDALDEIKTGKYKDKVNKIRKLQEGSEEQRSLKGSLKAYMFSGQFFKRENKSLKEYSNLFILDIDDLTQNEMEKLKTNLLNDPYVFSYWTSPGGSGIKGLIMYNYNNKPKSTSDYILFHKKAFDEVLIYFEENYHTRLDTGREVSRLCYTSYDPDLVIKDSFIPFEIDSSKYVKDIKASSNQVMKNCKAGSSFNVDDSHLKNIQRPSSQHNRRKMNSIIKYLSKRERSITNKYPSWYLVGQAIANLFSYNIGKEYYLKLCRLDGNEHSESKSFKKIIECYENTFDYSENRVGMPTINRFANEQGYSKYIVPSSAQKTDMLEKI